ncbi:MAG: DUF2279 domain-containing protein [Myxococcales bacterium]|nr:DUF2279 domain-containing protein [Myxococcales bacterium]
MRPNAALGPGAEVASAPNSQPAISPAEDAGVLKRRKRRSLLAVGGTYAAITTWMYFAWFYDKPELPNFTFGGDRWFQDSTYAGGADKLGHMWSGYALGRLTTTLLRRGGWSPGAASILGSSLSCALFTYVEIHDGFYYQMSPGDLAGDATGCLLSWVMERSPTLDRMFDLRVEYVSSPEYRRTFLDGDINIAEDYSGQSFMLAAHIGEMPWLRAQPSAKYLRYVDVVVGFKTRNYKPDPDPELGKQRRQTLFLGLSLNAQAVWDDVFARQRKLRRIGHGIFEVANLPYTSLPLVKATRSPDD